MSTPCRRRSVRIHVRYIGEVTLQRRIKKRVKIHVRNTVKMIQNSQGKYKIYYRNSLCTPTVLRR